MVPEQDPRRAYLFVSVSILLWASTAAVGKLLLEDLDSLQALLFMLLFASAALIVIALAQGKSSVLKRYSFRDVAIFAGMGFLGVFGYHAFLLGGLAYAPAQEAFILNYTWPLWVVVFSVLLLKRRFTWRSAAAIVLSFLGVVVVATKGTLALSFTSVTGDLFALAGAVCYGLFSVLGVRLRYDSTVSMASYYVFGTLFAIPTVLLFSSVPAVSPLQMAGLAWLGVLTCGVAFLMWFLALKHGDTAKMANIVFLTPFLSLVYIHFLLGEAILLSSLVGLMLIVAGIAVQSLDGTDAPVGDLSGRTRHRKNR
ncbi:TPA: DMT family transporter [Candidatus Woesearchaeota archaeon]|nr:DMT family transporter [Candidatus Woesearchaeota archaeon]